MINSRNNLHFRDWAFIVLAATLFGTIGALSFRVSLDYDRDEIPIGSLNTSSEGDVEPK